MSNKDSTPGFAIGFVLGATIGLVAALIFAPRSGKETRDMLKDKASDVPETIREHTANREKIYKEAWEKRKGQPKVSESYFE